MTKPKSEDTLTVIFVCRNHSAFVTESLDSILTQGYPNLELLIFDVASEDDSVEKILQWRQESWPDAQFYQFVENVGIVRVLKEAVAKAQGDYVRLLSTDDFFPPNSLAKQIKALRNQPDDVALCFGDAILVDREGSRIGEKIALPGTRGIKRLEKNIVRRKLMAGNWIAAPTVMMRRATVIEAIQSLDETVVFEDYQLWLKLSESYSFLYLAEDLAGYRQHPGSFTGSKRLAVLSLEGEIKTIRRAIDATPEFGKFAVGSTSHMLRRAIKVRRPDLAFRVIAVIVAGIRLSVRYAFNRPKN